MYEDTKFKLNINWKSLVIKLAILLLVVFLICFIVFRPKKDNSFIAVESNIASVKEAAILYYQNNFKIEKIGDYQKVTLKELLDNELVEAQEDNKGNTCSIKKSYAYLTKTRDDEFILKVNIVCGDNEASKVYNLTNKDLSIVANKEEEKNEPVIEEEIFAEEDIKEPNGKEEIIEEDKEIADNSSDNKKEESNKTHIDFGNDELLNELRDPNSTKVIRYKHIRYGEWIEGSKYGDNIENSSKDIYYYDYCLDDYCVLDRIDNVEKYVGYTATFNRKETIPVYRYIYVVWSNSTCIKGFINTGIAELR